MAQYKKLTVALLSVFISSFMTAQDAATASAGGSSSGVEAAKVDPASQYSEADRPEDNYLARFHANDVVDKLMKSNLEQIFTLNVVKENFKDTHPEWQDEYKKVYEGYKLGCNLYYRRNIVYSRVKLEENKKMINQHSYLFFLR